MKRKVSLSISFNGTTTTTFKPLVTINDHSQELFYSATTVVVTSGTIMLIMISGSNSTICRRPTRLTSQTKEQILVHCAIPHRVLSPTQFRYPHCGSSTVTTIWKGRPQRVRERERKCFERAYFGVTLCGPLLITNHMPTRDPAHTMGYKFPSGSNMHTMGYIHTYIYISQWVPTPAVLVSKKSLFFRFTRIYISVLRVVVVQEDHSPPLSGKTSKLQNSSGAGNTTLDHSQIWQSHGVPFSWVGIPE